MCLSICTRDLSSCRDPLELVLSELRACSRLVRHHELADVVHHAAKRSRSIRAGMKCICSPTYCAYIATRRRGRPYTVLRFQRSDQHLHGLVMRRFTRM